MMFINLKWKISAHASGVAGPVTALYSVYGSQILPLYLLLLPVFALRLKLKAHNIWQLIGGTVLAITVTYIVYGMML
jgi:membrane-associated phospholipid phosphatase